MSNNTKNTRKRYNHLSLKEREIIDIGLVAKKPQNQIKSLFEDLEYLESKLASLEKVIKLVGSKYYKQIDILTSMKGISVMTAIAIISDIATIKRFPNSKHFSSYLRSTPGIDSSNDTVRVTRTTKYGRKLSVTLLSQSLNHFRDSNEKLNRWYRKKVEVEKHKNGALQESIYRNISMLKKEEYHYWRDEVNHKKKTEEYDNLLKNYDLKKIRA